MDKNLVEVGIETKVSGEKKIESYSNSLEKLDKIKLENLNKAQSNVANLEARLKGAADAAERLNKQLGNNAKLPSSAKLANETAKQTAASAKLTAAETKLEAANKRAAISSQNLASAQTRADQSQTRAAISAQNLSTAQERANISQARAAVSAQNLANAQARTAAQTANLNNKLNSGGFDKMVAGAKRANAELGKLGQNISNAGRSLTATVTTGIIGLGFISLESAKNLDVYRNRLTAFEGSVAAAESKIAQLRKVAQTSAGVTTTLALDTYSQLTSIGELTEQTIEKQIKASGKLNSAFSIPDPKEFNRNLVQIFQQGFERQDIKQALGTVPIFEQLLEQAFGTKDPEKLRQLKNAGKLTLDSFIAGLAEATNNDSRLKDLGDSIGVRLTKTFEQIQFALAPLGDAIFKAIEPLIPIIVSFIEGISSAFAALSPTIQQIIIVVAAVLAAAGPALILIGGIISGVSSVIGFLGSLAGVLSTIGGALVTFGGFISGIIGLIGQAGLTATISALVSVLGGALLTALGAAAIALAKVILAIAAIVVVVTAVAAVVSAAVYLLYRVWQKNIGGIQEKTLAVFNAVKNFVFATFNQIKAKFLEILPYLEQITQTILSAIEAFWNEHGETITTVVTVAWNAIKVVVTEGINIIADIIKFTLQLINGNWEDASDTANKIIDSAWKITLTIIGAAVRLVLELLWDLIKSIIGLYYEFQAAAQRLGEAFGNALAETIRNAPALIAGAIDYLINQAVFDAYNAAYNAGVRLWGYLRDGFNGGQAENPVQSPTGEFIGAEASMAAKLPPKRTGGGGSGGGKKRGGGSGGGRKGGGKRDIEPIDAAETARAEGLLKKLKANAEIAVRNLELAREWTRLFGTELNETLNLNFIALTNYYRQLREEREKADQAEIADLERQLNRAQLILSKVKAGGSRENRQEFDKRQADVIKLTTDLELKRNEAVNNRLEIYKKEIDSIIESANATQELQRKVFELNNQTKELQNFDFNKEFDGKFEQNLLDLKAARQALKDAIALPDETAAKQDLITRYQFLVNTLTKNAELLEQIKLQKEAQNAFNLAQEDYNRIINARDVQLKILDQTLSESGADDDKATKARRETMELYGFAIDKVISKMEVLAKVLKNPEALKAFQEIKLQRADNKTIPFTEKLRAVQIPLEQGLRARDRALKENELSGGSDFEKEVRRLEIIKETTAELLKQADAYVVLAMQSGNPKLIDDALAQRDAIRQSGLEVQDFGQKLRNGAIDTFATGFTNFLSDIASGTVSAGDALLNFAQSFIQAIQQIIIQMLALMAIKALLKAFGIDIPISLGGTGGKAGGGAANGSKDGGAASRLAMFAGNFAAGGAPNVNKYAGNVLIGAGGFISGVGGPRTDSIPAFFPAARKFGNVSNTEFILDAETTRNIGVDRLNALLRTKGRGAGSLFSGLAQRAGNFAEGGAASESVLAGIRQFETPEINGGGVVNNNELKQLNYIGKKSIEEVIADYGLSSAGDKLLINQIDRNIGKLKAKLGIKS